MIENFRYLLLIRLFTLAGIVIVFAYLDLFTKNELPLIPICIIVTVALLITFWSWFNLKKQNSVSASSFFIQLLIDITTLSLLIYFSGGSVNPLISLFIIPVIFSASSLPRHYTWFLTFITISCYTALMFFQVPINHEHHYNKTISLHLWGMWYGFVLSVFLIAYFVSRISYNLREHQQLLAKARENVLRDEQIVALGTLAANTAHELSTPLSTIAILANELEHEYSENNKTMTDDLALLKSQITRCKAIISKMTADAGELRADSGTKQTLNNYLHDLVDNWANELNNIDVIKKFNDTDKSPTIVIDRSLTYAFTNILINSAQASTSKIVVEADWDESALLLKVKDNGHGIDRNVLKQIGNNIVAGTGLEKGMGIGLFLAKTTIERFGGSLSIESNSTGTIVTINVPLQTLATH